MQADAADVMFPPAARAMQERFGSKDAYAEQERRGTFRQVITPDLAAFLERLNSFYMATATRDGRPYIQHRGGPKGFLRVLGATTLGFADFSGNKQYITAGNLSENPFVHLFLMDYARRTRIKIWGRARVIEDDPDLLARLADPSYVARVERAIVIEIDAWDINCRQHIPQRFDAEDVSAAIDALKARIAELESENAGLRERTSDAQVNQARSGSTGQ
jgi:uncharacterized protein